MLAGLFESFFATFAFSYTIFQQIQVHTTHTPQFLTYLRHQRPQSYFFPIQRSNPLHNLYSWLPNTSTGRFQHWQFSTSGLI